MNAAAAVNGAKPSNDMRKLNLNRIMTVFRHLARNNNAIAQNLNQSVVEFENNLFQRAQSAADYTRMAEQELQRVCARFGASSAETAPGEATAQPAARPHPMATAVAIASGPTGQTPSNPTGQAPAAAQQQLTEAQLATLLSGISPQLVLPEDQLRTLSQLPYAQQQQYIRAQYMNVKNQQTALLQQQKQQPAPPQPTNALGSAPPTSQTTASNPVANGATKDNQAALLQAQRADLNQLMVTLMRNPEALVSFVSQLPNPAPAGGVPLKFQQRTVNIPKPLIEKLQMEVQRRQKQQEAAAQPAQAAPNQPALAPNSTSAPPSNPAAMAMGTPTSQPAPGMQQTVPQSQAMAAQPPKPTVTPSKPPTQAPVVPAPAPSAQPHTASPAVAPPGQPLTGSAPPPAAATAVGGENPFEQQIRLMVLKRVHGFDITEHLQQLDEKDKHLVQQLIFEYQDIVGALETVCAAFVARQREMHPMFQSFLNMKALIFKQMDLFASDQYIVVPEKLRDMCTKVEELVHKLWSLVPGNRPLPQRRSVVAQQAQALPNTTTAAPVAPSQPPSASVPAASLPAAPAKAGKHALGTSEAKQPSRKKAAVNKGSTGNATPTMAATKATKNESATPIAKKGKDTLTESPTTGKGAKASTARSRTTKASRPKKESTRTKATGTKKGTKTSSKPSTPVIPAKEAGNAVVVGSAAATPTTLATTGSVLTPPNVTTGSIPAVAAAHSVPGPSKPSPSPAPTPVAAPTGTPKTKPKPLKSSPAVTTPKALDPDVKWARPADYFTEMLRGLCSSGPPPTVVPPSSTSATVPGLSLAALFGPPLAQQSQWFD
ncbi:hypothetical protein H4R34_003327 [Dimargaris verticillata]|uniref:Uncharacterized protein n=1 Tax=Dimargaris verticillata TaxID=2761393 RepID=A0A9W8B2E0_9FUNG|nr:hypothetical protein H4R34_003327 [Dimargaris verticillata]